MAGIVKMRYLCLLPASLWLISCASTEELFAEYDEHFCPAPQQIEPVLAEARTIEKEVFRDRIIVKEVATAGEMMPWDPAIYFDTDSAEISKAAKSALQKNLVFLKKFTRYKVSIRGFTDQHAYDDYNLTLSVSRITQVRDYYRTNGIPADRIVGRAHGESLSISDSDSPVIDDINRRVEMILLDATGRPVIRQQPVFLGPAE